MSNVVLPTIEHADVSLNDYGRVNIHMHEGYVFYNRDTYSGLTDEEGNPREPLPEEISYFRAIYNLPLTFDFTNIVVVTETDVPANQIFGAGSSTETV